MSKPKRELENNVLYSEHRFRVLTECARRYWYEAYASWGGWWSNNKPPPERAEKAYWAKNATTAAMYSGDVVHRQAAYGLQLALEGRTPSREELRVQLLTRAATKIDRDLDEARNQLGQNPKRSVRFVELQTGKQLDEEYIRRKVTGALMALTGDGDGWFGAYAGTNLYMRAMSAPTRLSTIDEMAQFRHPNFPDIPVFLAADLTVKGKEPGSITVLDWKVGKQTDDYHRQMVTYGAWMASKGFTDITLLLVFLGFDRTDVVQVPVHADAAINQLGITIEDFLNELRDRLVDGDLVKNQPIEARFESTTDVHQCRSCPFAQICERDGTRPTTPSAWPTDADRDIGGKEDL